MKTIIIASLMGVNAVWAAETITSYDEIYKTDGTVVKGTITEKRLGELLLVETLDGPVIIEEVDVKIIREDIPLSYSEKSPALALVLSIIFPGVGQYYNGDIWKGVLQEGMYITGVVLIVKGLNSPAYNREGRRNKILVGSSFCLSSIIWTLIDAPLGAKKATKKNSEKAYTEAISE